MRVPDHCVSVSDKSLTETGKGLEPVHNHTETISAACHLYSCSILFSSFLQDPHLTITVVDVHPRQHLKSIAVPPTLQRLHPLVYFHISSRKYSRMHVATASSHQLSNCWCTKRYPGDAALEETAGAKEWTFKSCCTVCDIEATDTWWILLLCQSISSCRYCSKDREKKMFKVAHTPFLKCICFDRLYILLCAIWAS